MRLPGIEPGSSAWEAPMITITLQAPDIQPGNRCGSAARSGLAAVAFGHHQKQKMLVPGGTRTPNLLIRSQTPCPIGPQGHAHPTKRACRVRIPTERR